MSMENETPQLATSQKRKKHEEKHTEKSEKKRKQRSSDVLEPSSPSKRPKRSKRSKPLTVQVDSGQSAKATRTSPFLEQTSSIYVPLAPVAQRHPIQGLCAEHLSPLILTYYPPFHGVIISYANPRCTSNSEDSTKRNGRQKVYARSINEYAASFVWLTADFLIFRPQKGDLVEGYINLQNESNIGLVCWNFFTASIESKRLPRDWRWVPGGISAGGRKRKLKRLSPDGDVEMEQRFREEDDQVKQESDTEGYFQDESERRVGGLVQFRVQSADTSGSLYREHGFLSIHGSMLTGEEEEILQREESSNAMSAKERRSLTNGHDVAINVGSIPVTKYKAKY